MNDSKTSLKFLIISDIHDRIFNVRKMLDKIKTIKFDYVICCGDIVTVPTGKNAEKETITPFMPILKNIFLELEKIAPILWVPGNHDPYMYYTESYEEVTSKSKNLHKKYEQLDDNLYIVGLGGSVPILTGGTWTKDLIPFKDLDLNNVKYNGYPYDSKIYSDGDDKLLKDLNEIFEKIPDENSQMILLSHLGPLYTNTNFMEEDGEVLYLGSKNLGEKYEKENRAFINIHGHTHLADGFVTLKPGKYVFNPGACYEGNYGILEIRKDEGTNKWDVGSCIIEYLY